MFPMLYDAEIHTICGEQMSVKLLVKSDNEMLSLFAFGTIVRELAVRVDSEHKRKGD